MRQIFLTRNVSSNVVTVGMLHDDSNVYALTIENPWKDNEENISCIPVGNYVCEVHESPKYGKVYHVLSVPGRTHILIHAGNYERNTLGCILLGKSIMRDDKDDKPAVGDSRDTIRRFRNTMNNEPFMLTIRR